MITLNHKQKLNQWLFGMLLVSSLFYPLYGILCLVLYPLAVTFCRSEARKRRRQLVCLILSALLAVGGVWWQILDPISTTDYLKIWFNPFLQKFLSIFGGEYQMPTKALLMAWLVSPLGWKLVPNSVLMFVIIITDCPVIWRAELEMKRDAVKKHDRKESEQIHTNTLPLVADKYFPHILEVGATGMGKTTAIYDYIDMYLMNKCPVIVVSGKKSTESDESMITALRKRSAWYRVPLHIVSFDPNIRDREPINIFEGMTETQLVDTLALASDFSDAYYENVMRNWVKALALVMKRYGIPYSLKNIVDCWDWEMYTSMLDTLSEEGKITESEYRTLVSADMMNNYKVSLDSVSRYKQFLIGEEAAVIEGENPINISKARQEHAIIYIDLDSHSYTEFTKVIGRFVISDIARCIANEDQNSVKERKLVVLDEVQSYATEKMESLYTQSRSAGYAIISALQTPSDLNKVSPTLQGTIMGNCGCIICFRLPNPTDRELLAKAMGSDDSVNVTAKSAESDLDGAGTLKMGHEFKLNPDDILKLNKLEAYAIDFNRNTVRKYKFSWVPLHEKMKSWRH